jgi:hypothetical protein
LFIINYFKFLMIIVLNLQFFYFMFEIYHFSLFLLNFLTHIILSNYLLLIHHNYFIHCQNFWTHLIA